jgi:hypothetical protein
LESTIRNKYPDLFETGKFFVVHVSPIFVSFFFVEAAEFEDEFFLGGECNAKKIIESGSGVDQNFDFLNRCSNGRSETADAKISSKRDYFTIHMIDLEVEWITCG